MAGAVRTNSISRVGLWNVFVQRRNSHIQLYFFQIILDQGIFEKNNIMKHILFTLFVLAVISTTGCIRSLNPIVTYDDMITDDRIIGSWQLVSDDDMGFPREMSIGRVCRPIYEKYMYITNAEGRIDSNHTITALSLQSSLDDYKSMHDDMKFVRLDSVNFYYAKYIESDEVIDAKSLYESTFKISLTELNGQLYFDLVHKEDPTSYNTMTSYNIPAHFIGKVEISEGKLELKLLDADNFSQLLKNKVVRMQHQILEDEDEEMILTASTEDLRSFFGKYGERDDYFSESIIYKRGQ